MPTKDALIRVLEENRNRAVSGQELADTLHITRAAVWKAVRSLQEDGYHIEAMRNRGYRLSPDTDVLSAQGVALFLPEEYRTARSRSCRRWIPPIRPPNGWRPEERPTARWCWRKSRPPDGAAVAGAFTLPRKPVCI